MAQSCFLWSLMTVDPTPNTKQGQEGVDCVVFVAEMCVRATAANTLLAGQRHVIAWSAAPASFWGPSDLHVSLSFLGDHLHGQQRLGGPRPWRGSAR